MNTAIVIFFLAALSVAHSEPPMTYGAPSQGYGAPGGGHGMGGGKGYEEPQAYEFGYRVKDDYSGSSFHQKEASDGSQVRGEYRVQLPDGRTQIVTYYADWQTGFHADVKYEGQATYPAQKPQQTYGAPSAGGGGSGYSYPSPGGQYGAPR
ncbi:pro-resilin-like [Anthonomus grandis grandis]|uniref:pro-resilin-like n=1 Tax=Anthonomus grandis grandis TaxID=2921223 RepID=UPI00216555E4|nr:pro-resilin-like [Anthonomus grandis grandis]